MAYPWTAGEVVTATDLNAAIAAAGGSPGGSDGYIQYNNGGAFGGASALYYDDVNSRVGIGTTTPSTALHVAGSILSDDSVTIGSGGQYVAGSIYSDANWGMILRAKQASPAQAEFRFANSSDTELMRIDSSGRVGIGTTTPGAELDIKGASNPEIRLQSTDSSDPFLYFGDQVDAVRGGIGYDTSANALQLRGYNNSTRMTIDSSGNVGINDTTPSYTLDVNGTGRFTGTLTLDGDLTGTSNSNFFVGNDSNERILFQESTSRIFFMANGTYRWYIDSNGDLLPYANKVDNIGSTSLRVSSLYGSVINIDDEIQVGDGSAADPSYTFSSDGDCGMYRNTTDQISLTAGGSVGLTVAAGTVNTAGLATATTSGYQYVLRNNTFGTLYRFTSNRELKENITDVADSGAIIDALRPVTFNPKFIAGNPTPEDEGIDPTVETDEQKALRETDLNYGFIAEEVALVADGKLAQWEWTEDDLVPSGWKWSDVIAVLVAEMQQVRTRLTSLEAS